MAVTSNKYIIQNMERLSGFDLTDGTCLFVAEDLQEANMTNEQEDVYATGKNGVKIGSGSRNKASRITATSGSILDGVIATQVGSDIKLETVHVPHMEILTVGASKTATLTYKAIGAEGNEVPFIYERNSDGTLGKKYAINSAATADQFSFNATTGVITCPTGMTEGTQIVVWYDVEAKNAKHIVNADNVFSRELKIVADVWARGTCMVRITTARLSTAVPRRLVTSSWHLVMTPLYRTWSSRLCPIAALALATCCGTSSSSTARTSPRSVNHARTKPHLQNLRGGVLCVQPV